ncbi:MAG: ankyrin repeat domain-containing protein [Succinivibrionaceae bacterium]|nr:ankyrin repeat domain-containing protein [Succinivibrionaceae bacterium]
MNIGKVLLACALCVAMTPVSAKEGDFNYESFKYSLCTGNGGYSDDMKKTILEVARSGNKLKDDCVSESMFAVIVRRVSSDPDFLGQLMAEGLDADYGGKRRISARMNAMASRTVENVKPLLTGNIDWSQTNAKGETLLMLAFANERNPDMAKFLLQQNIPAQTVNARNAEGRSVLEMIARRQLDVKEDVIQLLAQRKADFNQLSKEGRPLIQELTLRNGRFSLNEKLFKLFVANGADVNKPGSSGETLLHFMSHYDFSYQDFEKVLECGPDINLRDNHGNTPLLAMHANLTEIAGNVSRNKVTRKLLEMGADVNAVNKEGVSALMAALMTGAEKGEFHNVVEDLLKAGAKTDVISPQGHSVLYYAAIGGMHSTAARLLLETKPDLDRRDKATGSTALLLAILAGNRSFAEDLIRAGANVNLADSQGRTPLMAASFVTADSRLAKALIKAGADPKATDKKGRSALDHLQESPLAEDESNQEQIDRLREYLQKEMNQ